MQKCRKNRKISGTVELEFLSIRNSVGSLYTLFFIRMVFFSAQPQIFLSSISNFSYLQPTLPDFYVLKMIVSILCFILNTYLYPHTALSSFLKNIFMKSQPRYSYKIYSYKKKSVLPSLTIFMKK